VGHDGSPYRISGGAVAQAVKPAPIVIAEKPAESPPL
jgi:hypothetical protein